MIDVRDPREFGAALCQLHGYGDDDHFNVVGSALIRGGPVQRADVEAAIEELESLLDSSDDDREERAQFLTGLRGLLASAVAPENS